MEAAAGADSDNNLRTDFSNLPIVSENNRISVAPMQDDHSDSLAD